VFKKLDKLILKAFVGPFVATFFITLLVLLMQFFWLYIDDFVGKGLGVDIIFTFIKYQSAVLVPLALPLAILLSSLMTFGNLGESFELVAIKSSGISLLRFMRPLFIVAVFVSGIAFLFSNYIIPVAYLKSRTMLSDIVYAKPAFDLKEGEFYDKINGFSIKIGSKVNDSIIRDVIVYEQSNNLQDNFIIAKSGVMRVTDNKRFLEFDLRDGWRYQERGNQAPNSIAGTEYIRLGFKQYKKQFDMTSFLLFQTNDSVNRNNERVYSIRQLNQAIDSLKKENFKLQTNVDSGLYATGQFIKYKDSTIKAGKRKVQDSLWEHARNLDAVLPDSAKEMVHERAIGQVNSIRSTLDVARQMLKDQSRVLRKHKIEWHRKIVLSMACLILFLIGAPLGSIIRKGGLGTPLIAAIIFFMIFYFSTTMGEKLAKENTLSPFGGMWMAAFILVPVGIFLTYKAMRDSQLFNKEWYFRTVSRFKAFIKGNKIKAKV
jgi:lipopolysaccharide export system permease protein